MLMCLMLMKISIFFKNFKFEISKCQEVTFCDECPREFLEKVWLKKNDNCGRSSVLKFHSHRAPC